MKAATISALLLALKTSMDEKENRMKEANAAKNEAETLITGKAKMLIKPSLQEEKKYDRLVKECETAANEYHLAEAAWMDFVDHDWH